MKEYRSIPRVIARLDIKGPNLVKGVNFEGLRVLGKPEHFSDLYYQEGADELLYMDVVASLYGRNSLLEVVERTSREIFIPLTVGGGIRSLDDIRSVLRAGADKVCLNTAAIQTPELISEAARTFGSSTIVVSIEAQRHADGGYEAFVEYGRESTGLGAVEWACRAASLGAGELLVTGIHREGTGQGVDCLLVQRISSQVDIPVIAGGGVGELEHVRQALHEGKADAVALASVLHYGALEKVACLEADYQSEGNTDFLRRGYRPTRRFKPMQLQQVKQDLREHGVPCRLVGSRFA